jgi:hypothetical protein
MVRINDCHQVAFLLTLHFVLLSGQLEFSPLSVPLGVKPPQLLSLVRALIKDRQNQQDDEDEEDDLLDRPILFFVEDKEVVDSLDATLAQLLVNKERAVPVTYKPQAIFR